MKKVTLILLFCVVSLTSTNATIPSVPSETPNPATYVNDDLAKILKANMNAFVKMTPREYYKLTGKKLTLGETLKLKAAQKIVKKKMMGGEGMTKGVYILLAILGLAWIAMGVKDDWSGNNWWVNLILTALCWLPGFIHALVKMKEYYN